MLPASDQPTPPPRSRQLRRWGPIAAIVVVIAVVAAVVVSSGGSSKKTPATATGPTTTTAEAGGGGPGAISFAQAKARHLNVTFPSGCDQKTGRAAIPYYFAEPCYANAPDNGGATSPGVTATSIKVVLYQSQPDDPILNFLNAAIKNPDTNEQNAATYQGYDRMFESYYQTYGRKVDLVIFHASGNAADEVAARADAAKVAAMQPFAVYGGPVLSTAWADELSAAHIVCISCTGGSTPAWYAQRAPYVWTLTPNGDQSNAMLAEYVGQKLVGHPAAHAGDPALVSQPRKFGLLYINATSDSQAQAQSFADLMKTKYGTTLAASVGYTLDPASLQEQANSDIAKLKAAGVTSIIFSGDPVAPGTFTRQATSQQYFPEWIVGASALVDTAAFSRTYDQKQWAHAFGVSFRGAPTKLEVAGSYFLYQWFTGSPPPAAYSNGVDLPQPAVLYAGIQAAGPTLTPQNFQAGLFTVAPRSGSVTNPAFSYGNHGLWSYPSYNGLDDTTEIWWDETVSGPDEVNKQGQGLYRYVDNGKRYLLGQWPNTPDTAFDPANTATIFEQSPPSDAVPNYPSPAHG